MSIVLYVGNIGSGKTAFAVREMVRNEDNRKHYTDIIPTKPRKTPQIIKLTSDMLVNKELIKTINHKDGRVTDQYKYSLNEEFWKERMDERKSIVIDECHKYLEARAHSSTTNRLFNDFLALGRRIVEDSNSSGDMIFITQLSRRADIILREMAHEIKYFVCHYIVQCKKCGAGNWENSEMPVGLKLKKCPRCNTWMLQRHSHYLEIKDFANIKDFDNWNMFGKPDGFFYRKYYVRNIGDYFQFYSTLQWGNMFSGLI